MPDSPIIQKGSELLACELGPSVGSLSDGDIMEETVELVYGGGRYCVVAAWDDNRLALEAGGDDKERLPCHCKEISRHRLEGPG